MMKLNFINMTAIIYLDIYNDIRKLWLEARC